MLLMPQRAQGVQGCMGQCEQKSPEGRAWPQWPGTHEGHTFWAEVARGCAGGSCSPRPPCTRAGLQAVLERASGPVRA